MTASCLIVFTLVFTCLTQISPVQPVTCYTCIDCGDPFDANSPNVSRSAASCYYCYKLTVYMAYAPSRYIVKECVQTCTESRGMFGGSSLEVNCCSSSLCNTASPIHHYHIWSFFLWILGVLMAYFIHNIS